MKLKITTLKGEHLVVEDQQHGYTIYEERPLEKDPEKCRKSNQVFVPSVDLMGKHLAKYLLNESDGDNLDTLLDTYDKQCKMFSEKLAEAISNT